MTVIAENIVKEILTNIHLALEHAFTARMNPDIIPLFDQQMGGVLRKLHLNENGQICHEGLLHTFEHNKVQTEKAKLNPKNKDKFHGSK